MTAFDRKVINRAVMFMPYLRYSLRLLFYTLPVKHPAVTAVLAEMGSMNAEELRELLGEDGLPWNIGKIYFTAGGELKSVDLRRANPALNAVIDAARNRSLSQAIGIAPPWFGWMYNQMAQENSYTGKDWNVQGKHHAFGQDVPLGALDVRARILADDILSIAYPKRLLQDLEVNPLTMREDERLHGPQGDDSLLFAPRPTHYKGTTAEGKLQKKFGDRREKFEEDNESLIGLLIPLLPDNDRQVAEIREDKILKKAEGPQRKKNKGYTFTGGVKKKTGGVKGIFAP
jgi:hypothetical protein